MNANNQLVTETINSDTTITYAYDLNGNLISKNDGSDTTLYTWDWRDMLVQVSGSQSPVTSYQYDGDGNRISKTTDEVTTKCINDVGRSLVQVLMETNKAGEAQANYTYGNDLISSQNEQLATINYYHYDGLGTVRQLTDDTEAVVASYTYDAFGNVIASTGTSDNTYGFTGEQQFNEADNLVFLRARYYDSRVGRFISRDPIVSLIVNEGASQGLPSLLSQLQEVNAYVYAKNNPMNNIDPSGYKTLTDCKKEDKKCRKDCWSKERFPKVIICLWNCYGKLLGCVHNVCYGEE